MIYELFQFFRFSTIFSIRESKTWFICSCCCNSISVWLCWSLLSWSYSSLRKWTNFASSLRNSTASLLLFLFSSWLPPLHLPHLSDYFSPNVPRPFSQFILQPSFLLKPFLVFATSANSSSFFLNNLFNYGVNFIDLTSMPYALITFVILFWYFPRNRSSLALAVSKWPLEDLKFLVFHSFEVWSDGVLNLTPFWCLLSIYTGTFHLGGLCHVVGSTP